MFLSCIFCTALVPFVIITTAISYYFGRKVSKEPKDQGENRIDERND